MISKDLFIQTDIGELINTTIIERVSVSSYFIYTPDKKDFDRVISNKKEEIDKLRKLLLEIDEERKDILNYRKKWCVDERYKGDRLSGLVEKKKGIEFEIEDLREFLDVNYTALGACCQDKNKEVTLDFSPYYRGYPIFDLKHKLVESYAKINLIKSDGNSVTLPTKYKDKEEANEFLKANLNIFGELV